MGCTERFMQKTANCLHRRNAQIFSYMCLRFRATTNTALRRVARRRLGAAVSATRPGFAGVASTPPPTLRVSSHRRSRTPPSRHTNVHESFHKTHCSTVALGVVDAQLLLCIIRYSTARQLAFKALLVDLFPEAAAHFVVNLIDRPAYCVALCWAYQFLVHRQNIVADIGGPHSCSPAGAHSRAASGGIRGLAGGESP